MCHYRACYTSHTNHYRFFCVPNWHTRRELLSVLRPFVLFHTYLKLSPRGWAAEEGRGCWESEASSPSPPPLSQVWCSSAPQNKTHTNCPVREFKTGSLAVGKCCRTLKIDMSWIELPWFLIIHILHVNEACLFYAIFIWKLHKIVPYWTLPWKAANKWDTMSPCLLPRKNSY